MKIDQTANPLNSVPSPAKAQPAKDVAPPAAASVSTPLPANLSSLTAQVRQLQTQLAQPGSGDFDTAKVTEIRQAISDGRYQVNPEKIADGLLDTVRDLLGKRPS
ncbi:flagellar biosynthesis anti-sigma factor FlgM [Paraherbaspirillum soli]|uniref:Negative regulator of flagellin synthesis n=1 Tax=Paraherbaspirillum soli TaxID=631222 RepID=A0ABW0MCS2_9BURK